MTSTQEIHKPFESNGKSALSVSVYIRSGSPKDEIATDVRNINHEVKENSFITVEGNILQITHPKNILEEFPAGQHANEKREFTFDNCFTSSNGINEDYATQDIIYDKIGKTVVKDCFEGFNCCVFAYGQTGSGKTYTIMGQKDFERKGLIPRICQELFDQIEVHRKQNLEKNSPNIEQSLQKSQLKTIYTIQVSYFEIYMEKVCDLLDNGSEREGRNKVLQIKEHPITGSYVEDLTIHVVNSYEEIEEKIQRGDQHRTIASTNMNEKSSASHTIFTIELTQTLVDPISLLAIDKTAKISLIDLCGSEQFHATDELENGLNESSEINKSLNNLGRVISTLNKPNPMLLPSYHDSVLTLLLKESLRGNTKIHFLAIISPYAKHYEETMKTLRYAESVKKIINQALVNEDSNAKLIQNLRNEIEDLKMQLSRYQDKLSVQTGISASLNESQIILSKAENIITSMELKQDVPCLVNLNENICLMKGESLVYYIQKGFNGLGNNVPKHLSLEAITKKCIRPKSEKNIPYQPIRLVGEMESLHCLIEYDENELWIHPLEGAKVMINGIEIVDLTPTRIHHQSRIRLADKNLFRVFISSDVSNVEQDVEEKGREEKNLSKLIQEANKLCDQLELDYRVCVESLGNDEFGVRVLLNEGKKSSVLWEVEVFEERLSMLRNLITSQHSRLSRIDKNATLEDPFFEVRSTSVRLLGHSKCYLRGIQTLSDAKYECDVPVYDTNGHQIAFCSLILHSLQQEILLTSKSSLKDVFVLTPRGSKKKKSKTKCSCIMEFQKIQFIAGFYTEGLYATYRRMDEEITRPTKKAISINDGCFQFSHRVNYDFIFPTEDLPRLLQDACILIDIWGMGALLPVVSPPFVRSITNQLMNSIKEKQQSITAAPSSSIPTNTRPRRKSLSLSGKMDIFVSIDVEESGNDGIYEQVTIKEDTTFRLIQSRERRLIVRITQADHQNFCLKDILQIRMQYVEDRKVEKKWKREIKDGKDEEEVTSDLNEKKRPPITDGQWITLLCCSKEADEPSRTFTCKVKWPNEEEGLLYYPEKKCKNGERQIFRLALGFSTTKSDIPVIISKMFQAKMYPKRGILRSKLQGAWWARDRFSRTQRLGSWYAVELTRPEGQTQRSSSSSTTDALASRLLDVHEKGVDRLKAAQNLDQLRQQIRMEMEVKEQTKSDSSTSMQEWIQKYPLIQIQHDWYLNSIELPTLFSHLHSGILIDTTVDQKDEELSRQTTSHFVTAPTNFDQDAGEICGFLMVKESSLFNKSVLRSAHSIWSRRWFVLQRPVLYYYESFAKKKPLDLIDVSRCQINVHPSDTAAGIPFSFHLIDGEKKWHLQASTASELRAWLVAIDPLKIDAREALLTKSVESSAPMA